MKLGHAVFVGLFLASCCGPTRLVPVPEDDAGSDGGVMNADAGGCTPYSIRGCYDGPGNTQDVGNCHGGTAECSPDGVWGPCDGEVLPKPEICNCQDNDCDGVIGNIPDIQFCYDGPSGTAGVGVCHPGVEKCGPYDPTTNSCPEICSGEQTPEAPVCDGIDHQCVGHAEQTTGPVDVVFMLDNTDLSCEDGNQTMYFQYAEAAMERFAALHQGSNIHYALVFLPGDQATSLGNPGGRGYAVIQPLTDELSFQSAVAGSPGQTDEHVNDQCDIEPYYPWDVLFQQASGEIVPWEPGAERYLILFTGDEGESAMSIGLTEVSAALVANSVNTILIIGNNEEAWYGLDIGELFDWGGTDQILGELQSNITFPCDGGVAETVDGGIVTVAVADGGTINCVCVGQTPYCPCFQSGVGWTTCTPPFTPLPNPCAGE